MKLPQVTDSGIRLYEGIDPLQNNVWEMFFSTTEAHYGCGWCGHDCGAYPLDDLEAACTCNCHNDIEDDYCYDCEICGGEIYDDHSTCICEDDEE
jgi:hypothetical protein